MEFILEAIRNYGILILVVVLAFFITRFLFRSLFKLVVLAVLIGGILILLQK